MRVMHIQKSPIYSLVVGYGSISLIASIFSFIGLYNPVAFCVVILGILVMRRAMIKRHLASMWAFRSVGRKKITEFFTTHTMVKLLIVVWVILYFAISLLPSAMSGDALSYHLPNVLDVIAEGRAMFPILGNLSYGHLPLATELFYGIPILLFHNLITFKIIQFSAFLCLAALIADWLQRQGIKEQTRLIASVLLLAMIPLVKSALDGGSIDIFTILFGVASTLVIFDIIMNVEKSERHLVKELVFAGVLMGFALSTKYLALLFLAVNVALLLVWLCMPQKSLSQCARHLYNFMLPTILVSALWYGKNVWYTANPFFPMFEASMKSFTEAIYSFVVPPTLVNLPILPFYLFRDGAFGRVPFATLLDLILFALYGAFVWLFIKGLLPKRGIIVFAWMQGYLLLALFWSHQVRFVLPALIFAVVALVIALDVIMEKRPIWSVALLLVTLSLYAGHIKAFSAEYACVLGITDKNVCMERNTGGVVYVVDYINKNLANEKIINFWDISSTYSLLNGNQFSSQTYCSRTEGAQTEANIADCLRTKQIRYLITYREDSLSSNLYPDHGLAKAYMKEKIPIVEFFIKYGQPIFEHRDIFHQRTYRLYQIL